MNRFNNLNNFETGLSGTVGFDYKVKNGMLLNLIFQLAQIINEKENKKMSEK